MKKISVYLFTLIAGLQMIGCGLHWAQESPQAVSGSAGGEQRAYSSEVLELPHTYTMHETTYQNTLYYVHYIPNEKVGMTERILYRMDIAGETANPVRIPFDPSDEQEIISMYADMEGNLNLLMYDSGDSGLSEIYWIREDQEGNLTDTISVTDRLQLQSPSYPMDFRLDGEGNAYIAMDDGVYVLNRAGDPVFHAECEGTVYKLCNDSAGRVYIIWMTPQGDLAFAQVDGSSRTLGQRHNTAPSGGVVVSACPGEEGTLLFALDTGLFEYHLENETWQEKTDWFSLDMSVDYNGNLLPLTDGRVLYIGKNYQTVDVQSNATILRPFQEGDPVPPEKNILILGGLSGDIHDTLKNAVISFNRTNPDYRIEIEEYGTDDYQDGITRLNEDMTNDGGPDILLMPQRAEDVYSGKQMLEDLYLYIDRDATMERSDFQENVIKAYEVSGRLYSIPIFFSVERMVGKTSLIGDRDSWTLDELIAFANRFPDSELFHIASKSSVLEVCLKADLDRLISDSSSGGVDREWLIKLLNFSNRFINDETYTFNGNLVQRIEEDQLLLMNATLSGISTLQMHRAQFGEEITYIGFPAESGSGTLVKSWLSVAISAQSSQKEGAWQFIGYLLSEDFHDEFAVASDSGFSIRKSGLARKIQQETEATYVMDAHGNRLEEPKGVMNMGDITVDMFAATEHDVEIVMDMIESIERRTVTDSQIMNMIHEEAGAFFSESKTVEEVADILENRIMLYVNEMRG